MQQFVIEAIGNPGNQNNWSGSLRIIGQFFYIIIVFAAVILLAYFVTKWIAGTRQGMKRGHNNIRILESHAVGVQSSVQLLQVGAKYILISVTKERIGFLIELNKEEINAEEQTAQILPFESVMKRYFPSFGGKGKAGSGGEDTDE